MIHIQVQRRCCDGRSCRGTSQLDHIAVAGRGGTGERKKERKKEEEEVKEDRQACLHPQY